MKWKVCGMKYPDNIRQVATEEPDFMGFIFYKNSPRCVEVEKVSLEIDRLPSTTRTVGVFVNEAPHVIEGIESRLQLAYVQLHGDEDVAYVSNLSKKGMRIIKAFRIGSNFHWNQIKPFEGLVDYFLFDTDTKSYGGSGRQFDWRLIHHYSGQTPYILSGGLGPEVIRRVANYFDDDRLIGLDFNSKLESFPGMKNIQKVLELSKLMKNEFNIPS